MWHKTVAGFICGLITITLLPSSLIHFYRDLSAISAAFFITVGLTGWACIMTYCYGAGSAKAAWLRGLYCAVPAVLIYLIAFFT
ncbi:hypothetical protein L1077_18900 [Pseudoalteromonas luteoviolacea]|uniref:hypothetical protein n=1 Tax=Pseudoalteromonas luteoviolacea TaxID=43657 RepID=UPI001F42EB04|nr:hypothetical protein [Pseudoalteromonas luteoviolacea]MCF6441508.1 hypothetical protein [Pseudoalteromonas luteoviolacea]